MSTTAGAFATPRGLVSVPASVAPSGVRIATSTASYAPSGGDAYGAHKGNPLSRAPKRRSIVTPKSGRLAKIMQPAASVRTGYVLWWKATV